MGGLVCRTMIHRHPDTWARMGGRLVMLGTPNRGSFAPVLAVTGKDRKLQLLALLDGELKKDDVAKIVGTFPGLVQMLPWAANGTEPAFDALYDEDGWPGAPIDQRLLDGARRAHADLAAIVDPDRMIYIAGFGQRTIDGIERKGNRFRFRRSHAGDGTVPHALGLLDGVQTYWTNTKHGALAKDPAVLNAVHDLLESGATNHLVFRDRAPTTRDGDTPQWIDEDLLDQEVDAAVRRVDRSGRDLDVLDDVLPTGVPDFVQVPITIDVVWGGIDRADADVIVVGHYIDVYPTASEYAVDMAISGEAEDKRRRLLHAATARGVLKGALGDVFVVPWPRPDGRARTVLVLGLGRPGTFKLPQHEVLIRNMVWSAERVLHARTVASVLIGAGAGNLSVEDAIGSFVRALDAAVREGELTTELEVIRIVELELGRAREILGVLRSACDARDSASAAALITVTPVLREGDGGVASVETALGGLLRHVRAEPTTSRRKRIANVEGSPLVQRAMLAALGSPDEPDVAFRVTRDHEATTLEVPTRLSVLNVDGRIVASAVSNSATVPELDFGLDARLFTQLVDLANSQAGDDPTAAGKMLLRVAIRPEFRPLLESGRNVIVEVDRTTAALPWELIGSEQEGRQRSLGLRTPLARQLRTREAPPPNVTGRVVLTRALIIGDPAGGANHLPGAELEALAVASALHDRQITFDFLFGPAGMIDPKQRWRAEPATLAGVLHHLLHEEYQLVHYAGHGTFSSDDPTRGTGWVLADGLLTATHLTIVERLPALVVANACHSSRVSTNLPGLADEFMSKGVRHLVGTARTVDDRSAKRFSESFYAKLLRAERGDGGDAPTLGNAVLDGRRALDADTLPDWDVYQLYGDPLFRFWPDPR